MLKLYKTLTPQEEKKEKQFVVIKSLSLNLSVNLSGHKKQNTVRKYSKNRGQ